MPGEGRSRPHKAAERARRHAGTPEEKPSGMKPSGIKERLGLLGKANKLYATSRTPIGKLTSPGERVGRGEMLHVFF